MQFHLVFTLQRTFVHRSFLRKIHLWNIFPGCYGVTAVLYRHVDFLLISMIHGMQRQRPPPGRNVLSTLFSYSHPRSWRADGIPPDGYHPGQLFSPLRETRVHHLLPPSSLSRWPNASKKPKRFHMVKKKIKQKTACFVSNSRMLRGRDERGVIIGGIQRDHIV